MSDPGNAVAAEWVGPSGHQLYNGVVLNPGVVLTAIGKDEAEASPYWRVLGDTEEYTAAGDASSIRSHDSFGVEEGGGSTGRPLTEAQLAAAAAESRSASRRKPKDSTEEVAS